MPADTHRNKRQKLDAAHHKINEQIKNDEVVQEARVTFRDDLPDYFLRLLLYIIQGRSDGYLVVTDAVEVLEKNPRLKDMLRAAWKNQSYFEILELDYLQSSLGSISQSGSEDGVKSLEREAYQEPLIKAWRKPFRGEHHKVLFNNINRMYRSKYYGNICAIIQSSGTGKSRMVDEQAKLVLTLPINIRDDTEPVAAYPPADHALYKHLVLFEQTNREGCKAYYERFLACLFRHATDKLSTLAISHGDLALKWHEEMSDLAYRNEFYGDVVNLCKESCVSSAREELEKLISELASRSQTNHKIKVVIYIDEAHELRPAIQGITRLDLMCSVISRLSNLPLFCLLLSTQSSLHYLAPTSKSVSSERAQRVALLPPITETPFDCNPGPVVMHNVLGIGKLSEASYIAQWGRPLWWSVWQQDPSIERLLCLARLKLLGCHNIDASYKHQDMTIPGVTSILDVLLTFAFEPDCVRTDDIEAEMVKSHMRIVYSIPEHRAYSRSGYPSEPLLAEAAAQQLWVFQKLEKERKNITSFDIMVEMLDYTHLVDHSLIDLGQRGELMMRMCLVRAYMDGVLAELGDQATEFGIIFSRGCKLVTFIKELFAPEHTENVLAAVPDNIISATTFSEAFEDSMVRFTHFVKAGDEFALTTAGLYAAFARGAAFIAQQNQKYVDFVIPVLLNKAATIQESVMSAILIQVKRHTRASEPTKWTFSQKSIGLFPKAGDPTSQRRPYILLVAELGTELKNGNMGHIVVPSVRVLAQPERQSHLEDTHPRYNFVSYGGSAYKHVTPDKCAQLLATRNFVEEHPRRDPDSRNLVMRLKPVWEYGDSTYHWVKLPEPEE